MSLGNPYGESVLLPSDDFVAYPIVAGLVIATRNASVAFVQRKFQIGYVRAARFIERMEDEGLVSEWDGQGRTILAPTESGGR